MANMSYCRFQNTSGDLSDCLDAIIQGESLSESEIIAGKRMFRKFLAFCRDSDIIDGYDGEVLDELFDNLREEDY